MTRASVVDRLFRYAPPRMAYRRACRLSDRGRDAQAFRLFVRAARAGLAPAEYRIGRSYLEGKVVPRNRQEAVRWLTRAGERGSVEAQSLLAALYLNGHGIEATSGDADREGGLFAATSVPTSGPPDFTKAAMWAQRAAEKGAPDGQALWAYILTDGPSELRDRTASRMWYERAAAGECPQGHLGLARALAAEAKSDSEWQRVVRHLRPAATAGLAGAAYLLAVLLERGSGAPRDEREALDLYRAAAEKGYRAAQACLGRRLLEDSETGDSRIEGELWLRRAAFAGDSDAAARLGELHATSADGNPNFAEAAIWLKRAAEAGNARAARALGSLFATGAGVEQDHEAAAHWFRQSARIGDTGAAADLGNLLLKGLAEAGNGSDLRQHFSRAADTGDLVATYNLAVALAAGIDGERDDARAAQLMRRAAEGVAEAQHRLGRMLVEGRGVATNLAEARVWLARAASAGIAEAQALLGEMLFNGRGGPSDVAAARDMFERASRAGHAGSMFALGALHSGSNNLPPDFDIALRWFRAAAERGHGHAQLMVGRYFANGIAVERDEHVARQWIEKAAAQGVAGAERELTALAPH